MNRLLPPVQFVRNDVAGGFLAGFNLFGTDRIVGPGGERTANDHEESNDEHRLTKAGTVTDTLVNDIAFGVLREDVPLHGEAIETNHAVEFGDHEEDERVEHAGVVGMHADEVGVKAARVREHAHEVGEHEEEEQESRHELDHPERRVGVTEQAIVGLDVTALMVGGREATQSTEGVQGHADRDEEHKDKVEGRMILAVEEMAAREGDQVPENILTELHRARKGHVAEKEDAEDEAGDRLRDVADGRKAALTLGVLEAYAPDVFRGRRGVGVLDGFRGRHD